MSTTLRPLPLLLALCVFSCSGGQNPPPPVATATAARAADEGLQPMSSRDAATPAPPLGGSAPAGQPSLPPGHPPIGAADPHGNVAVSGGARSAGSVTGTITLSPKLQVGPKDVLYVMAKKGGSTLAVRRIEAPRFPLSFEISGADAMTAGVGFEGPVDLVARVSRSGDAIPSKGDLEGTLKNVKVPATAVRLTVDAVRP